MWNGMVQLFVIINLEKKVSLVYKIAKLPT